MKKKIYDIVFAAQYEGLSTKKATDRLLVLFDEQLKPQSDTGKLPIPHVSNAERTFCTCGNPSGEGNIQMVNNEEMLYFCLDCGKQVQNDC